MNCDRSRSVNLCSIVGTLIVEVVVLGFSPATCAQTPQQTLQALDGDSDGAISKTEARDEMKRNFSLIDANGDGGINLDELERVPNLVESQQGESSPSLGNESSRIPKETSSSASVFDRVEHHETDNDGVSLHYVALGDGPVILFVHGFPDFWYTWREQMAALSDEYKTVAMDSAPTTRVASPKAWSTTPMPHLLADVEAVIKDLEVDSVTPLGTIGAGSFPGSSLCAIRTASPS